MLEIRNLTASYGVAQALFGVALDVAEGEVVALMGRNGMGKTTTVKAICRMIASEGKIRFMGHDLQTLPSHKAARLGIGLVPEGRRCFRDLTVQENLLAAARPGDWTLETLSDLFPRLEERKHQLAASLSGGEQQMLAIGRALMTNPRLLILDEATEGLAPLIRQEIWSVIARVKRDTGTSILLIDKSLKDLSRIADKAVILARGQSVWSGPITRITPDLSRQYIGV